MIYFDGGDHKVRSKGVRGKIRRFLIPLMGITLTLILIFLPGCDILRKLKPPPSKAPGFNWTLSKEDGRASLETNFGVVNAFVQDENGSPFPGATISSYELEDGLLLIASREDAAPSIKFVGKEEFRFSSSSVPSTFVPEPQVAVVTIVFTLVAIASAAETIYEYVKNPGEAPIQIPGLLEGSRKVRSTCIQIDANDLFAIYSVISAGIRTGKALFVFGAPAAKRGVTAIKLGFTRKALAKKLGIEFGKRVADYLGLLDTDLINNCDYIYQDRDGNTYTIPIQKWEVIRKPPPRSRNILIYILSDRQDSWGAGRQWYKGPDHLEPVRNALVAMGYQVTVKDKVILPILTLSEMLAYSQVWILEGDDDNIIDVTQQESKDLYQYYARGHGIWLSFEADMRGQGYGNWVEDAAAFLQGFGVEYVGTVFSSRSPQPVYSLHPIFAGVSWISFDREVGSFNAKNSAIQIIWWYQGEEPRGSFPGVAILDGGKQGRGRVVFDSGWVLGYAYWGSASYDDRPHENLKFVQNVARWLESESQAPPQSTFIWLALGESISDPLQNTRDPREDGWYVANSFGNSCPSCSDDPTHPYHPGEDWNRSDGNDANLPTYAIADGEVIRSP